MKLSLEDIRAVTLGAQRIEETEKGLCFFRFNKAQEEMYKTYSAEFYGKSFSTAGIRMKFKTNSQSLKIGAKAYPKTTRYYFAFDIRVNGEFIGSVDNYSDIEVPEYFATLKAPLGEFSQEVSLGEGEKEVEIIFPWSVSLENVEFFIDDESFVTPVKPEKKLLTIGDSITHGYDALHPMNRYASKIADYLGAEELCLAIGGEFFNPLLSQIKMEYNPDYITVAYGTNDFAKKDRAFFEKNCPAFFEGLVKNFPKTPIFAITPIWRKDNEPREIFGEFKDAEEIILKTVEHYPNVTAIRGIDFVPHEEKYFGDARLHPNDKGFSLYADALIKEIKKVI